MGRALVRVGVRQEARTESISKRVSFNHSDISPAGVPDARVVRVGVCSSGINSLAEGGDPANAKL